MRTSSFIGLIFLVAALMVASVPALLEPSAAGVSKAAVKLGLAKDHDAAFKRAQKQDEEQSSEPTEPKLMLKGYDLTEDGDLRADPNVLDPKTRNELDASRRGRLVAGTTRTQLPGEIAVDRPAVLDEEDVDGMLLDVTGCPILTERDDVIALFADEEAREKITEKAAKSDDEEACVTSLNAALQVARDALEEPSATSPLGRQVADLDRQDMHDLVISLTEIEMLSAFMDPAELEERLAELE